MHRILWGLLAWLGLLGGLATAEAPRLQWLTGADARQAERWETQVEQLLDKDKLDKALGLAEKLHRLHREKQGAGHWETWDARFQVAELERLQKRPAKERLQLRQAVRLGAAGRQRDGQGRHAEAEQLYRQALAIRQKALPAGHLNLAQSLNNLATNLDAQGKYAEAEKLHRQTLALLQKAVPAGHPHLALSLNNLAENLHSHGKYAEAEKLHRQALTLRQKALPAGHLDLAQSLNNLAQTLRAQGKYAEAEKLHRQTLALLEKAVPAGHPHLALSLNNLAENLHFQGKYAGAEKLHRQALAIREKALRAGHPDLAQSLNNLAGNLYAQGKYAEAEKLHRLTLAMLQKAVSANHPHLAQGLNNMATTLQAQGKYTEAEKLHRQALAIREKALPAGHPDLAQSLNNLAGNLYAQGKYAEAEKLHRQTLALLQKALPVGHPTWGTSLNNLATTLDAQGKYAEAEKLFQQASRSFEIARLLAVPSGTDRALFAAAHGSPDHALATVRARLRHPRQAWRAAEAALARGLLDDLTTLAQADLSNAQRRHLQELNTELSVLSRQILRAHLQPRLTETQQKQLRAWVDRSRKLGDQLATLAAEQSRKQVASLAEVQRALPADTALVFWIDLYYWGKLKGEHWGCVVRGQGKPAWAPLPGSGAKYAWTRADVTLPARLRQALSRPGGSDWRQLARQLYRQRLEPLEPHLKGIRHLIAVPTGSMAGIPLEVLSDRFLVSYVPSGTVHARLRQNHRPLQASLLALGDPVFRRTPLPEPPDHGLYLLQVLPNSNAAKAGLKVGDVLLRYNGVKLQGLQDMKLVTQGKTLIPIQVWREGQVQKRSIAPGPLGVSVAKDSPAVTVRKRRQAEAVLVQRGGDYLPLPGTRLEVEALARLFPKKRLLLGSEASEQRLDELIASGELARYRILHFATHGQMHPTRPSLCALILAQDQLPDPARQQAEGKKVYDGRLTVEALQKWPLDADLVVFSACETGLGPQGGGDGFLGFSQVLFRQGARSLVLSLWKVDDVATALLMRRFYENLLGKRQGLKAPLGRAAALAEAKAWLRRLPRSEAERLAVKLSGGAWRGRVEKLRLAPEKKGERPPAPRPTDRLFAHPAYWSAFILLGDPE